MPIEFLRANPLNPRTHFDEDDLADLTASIREKGIIQPILVRTIPGLADTYEIIAGERRWRAAQSAGLHDVPVVALEADDKQALEIAIIENVQRTNLNAMEEAEGYERLAGEFGYTQGRPRPRLIGKSRPYVANTIRLLKLPPDTRVLLANGQITAGHARALLNCDDPDALAKRIVERNLSVRAVEEIVRAQADARDTVKAPRARRGERCRHAGAGATHRRAHRARDRHQAQGRRRRGEAPVRQPRAARSAARTDRRLRPGEKTRDRPARRVARHAFPVTCRARLTAVVKGTRWRDGPRRPGHPGR